MTFSFRPMLWPTLFAIPALAVLIGLGVWQLERREWKLALIDRVAQSMAATPAPLDNLLSAPLSEGEFHAVEATGRFLHDKEIHLFSHRGEAAGYEIITPLERADRTFVLVNRGFVPERLRDPRMRAAGQVSGTLTVQGWLRQGDERQWFTPPDEPAKNQWYGRDPVAMANANGVTVVAPIFLVANETPNPGGWPKGGMELNLRNQHLGYALTWFGVALMLIGVYVALHFSYGRARW